MKGTASVHLGKTATFHDLPSRHEVRNEVYGHDKISCVPVSVSQKSLSARTSRKRGASGDVSASSDRSAKNDSFLDRRSWPL